MEDERNFRLKHYDYFNRTTFSDVPLLLKLGSLSEDVFEPRTSTGSVVCYTAVFSVVMQRSSQALRDDTKNGCAADYRKWGLLAFYLPWSWQICIAKFLFSYKEDLPEILNQTTAQWCKNFTSGWRPSLTNAVANATHVNRKWGLLTIYMPWSYQICITKFLFSYNDDLLESLNQTTPQWCKKSTSGWRPSLKNAVA